MSLHPCIAYPHQMAEVGGIIQDVDECHRMNLLKGCVAGSQTQQAIDIRAALDGIPENERLAILLELVSRCTEDGKPLPGERRKYSRSEVEYLAVIRANPGIRIRDLAILMCVSRQVATSWCKYASRKGRIERTSLGCYRVTT